MVSVQRHLALLRDSLRPGEAERLWLRAERQPQGQAGALLLTDRRLLFSGMAFVAQAELAWPLAGVRAAVVTPGRPAALALVALGQPERFTGREADLGRLVAAFAGEEGAPVPDGLVGELERLASLRASGSLTEAEFEAAKARLLST